jgi:hypothetical protein
MSTKSVPTSTADKLPQKAVSTRNFFASLRTTEMDTETTGAENALPEQESPRKSGRPLPTATTSTTNLIQLQSDLKEHVRGKYQFRSTYNGTRIITKEMTDCSAMKSCLEKNNLHYFTFSPNSERPMKAVIHHLPPDTPAEDTSTSSK